MKKFQKYLLMGSVLFSTTIFFFFGCEQTSDPSNTGSLIVKITDAPFPVDYVEEAIVTIDKIEIRKKDDSDSSPYIVLTEGEMVFNLLELRNGVTTELQEINIPTGGYDLVRLYVKSANIVLKEGLGEFNLKVPSGAETGIKIFIDPELLIQGGLTAELLLDFDLSNSFKVQGDMNTPAGINGFIFTPVIRAVNNQLAGSIYGTVKDIEGETLKGVLVTVTLGEESASAITDVNGYYEILGLKVSSEYLMNAVLEGYVGGEVNGIEVIANERTEQNFELVEQ